MEHEDLLAKKDAGELEPEGTYVFYRVFIALSLITLMMAVTAFGLLVYIAYLFVSGKDVDTRPLVTDRRS